MKNERGAIQLIALVGIIILLIIAVFVVVAFMKVNQNDKNNEIIANTINEVAKEPNIQNKNSVKDEKNIVTEDFSLSFIKMENNEENMLYSPLSIKYGLKMLQEGASGNTKTQIKNVVGNLRLSKYENIDKNLSLVNGIYIEDTHSEDIKKDFKSTLTNEYNAEIKYDSFSTPTNINNWIEEKTLGQIENMLKDDDISTDTVAILINALAVDMEWESSFESKDTSGKEFYLGNGETMIATTMSKTTSSDDASYYLDDGITAISMDLKKYGNNKFEFIAIMPDDNLKEYVEQITIEEINKVLENLKPANKAKSDVKINIPKFSFDYQLNLKQDLINMGITDAFDAKLADFSNMADIVLYVSKALHKSNIDFSEKGVKAAAVTVFMMEKNAMLIEEETVSININKPFMFIIVDKETEEIWFLGTVYEPNSWENDKAEYSKNY